MHGSSIQLMAKLLDKFIKPGQRVIDIGAYDGSQSYRQLCDYRNLTYTGLDSQGGTNVDVIADIYDLPANLKSNYDVVISGQAYEHMEYPLAATLYLSELLTPDGIMMIIAPNDWEHHRCPIDCWRIFKDGMEALLIPFFEEVETKEVEKDTYGVGIKRKSVNYDVLAQELRKITVNRVKI